MDTTTIRDFLDNATDDELFEFVKFAWQFPAVREHVRALLRVTMKTEHLTADKEETGERE